MTTTEPKYTKPEYDDALADVAEPRLFEPPKAEPKGNLALTERFIMAPLSVLDTRSERWKSRKRQWLDLGLRSAEGRTVRMSAGGVRDDILHVDADSGEVYLHAAAPGTVNAQMLAIANGQSVFDPVLCELAYLWFSPPGGRVLDPYAGGSVRGLVAGVLGRQYEGIDLSGQQVEANEAQAAEWLERQLLSPVDLPVWYQGDSWNTLARSRDALKGPYDLLFSCPPYADLEVYSDHPDDLSNMPWPQFCERYAETIEGAVDRLADDRWAVFVVSEVRGTETKQGYYRDLVGETIRAFERVGARYFNELVVVAPVGTVRLRAARQFLVSRKIGRVHQTALVFVKGDPYRAAAAMRNDDLVAEAMDIPLETIMESGDEDGADNMSQEVGGQC